MNAHPAADLFPLFTDTELATLVESMRLHGYDNGKPVLRYQGMILDGRNRLRASEVAGVEPVFVDLPDDCDPYLESWKHNGARRDLSEGQKTAIRLLVLMKSEEWQREQCERKTAANEARTGRPRKGIQESAPNRMGGLSYACRRCAETFSDPVWHCPKCDHHWPDGRTECWNCHQYTRRPGRGLARLPHANDTSTATAVANSIGVSRGTVERVNMVAGDDEVKLRKLATGEVKLPDMVRDHQRAKLREKLEDVGAREAKEASGVYDVLVIDPPWPMKKIERDLFPDQVEFDYPTMTEAELAQLALPAADDCHVWLWTTHKFLPMAIRLLGAWGLKYVCTFVWHKPGGFQPIGLPQYNAEFAIYARKGSPAFLDTKDFFTCFSAARTGHSEKPEAFYEMVRRVTAGRRLDMFNRRSIDEFDGWGKEAAE